MQKYEDNLAARINGNNLQPLLGASVTVTSLDTGLPASLYSDNGVTPINTGIVTDNNGYFGFYAPDGKYTLTFSGSRFATFTREIVLEDPADNPYVTLAGLAAGSGAQGVGYNGRTVADKLAEVVSVMDAPFNAKGDGVTDDTEAWRAALSSKPSHLIVHGAGRNFRITDELYIRGDWKGIDLGTGAFLFDSPSNNKRAIVVDNPTATQTEFQSIRNMSLYFSDAARAATGCKGIEILGGVLNFHAENVYVQGVGQLSGNGQGYVVTGGAVGGNDTPYYGRHVNIKTRFCGTDGIVVAAPDGAPLITTHTFTNAVSGGNGRHGVWFKNAEKCQLDSSSIEQNGGVGIKRDGCKSCHVTGSIFVEGNHPDIETTSQDPLYPNVDPVDLYPIDGGSGTRPSTYPNNPALGIQGRMVKIPFLGSEQVLLGDGDVMEMVSPGTLIAHANVGTSAEFRVGNGAIYLTGAGGGNAALWSTTKDAAGKINVYALAGKYYVQNKTGSGIYFRFNMIVGFESADAAAPYIHYGEFKSKAAPKVWTPTISSTSGTIGGYTVDKAHFVEFGRGVMASVQFTITSAGTGSGIIKVSGLPIVCDDMFHVGHGSHGISGKSLNCYAYPSSSDAFVRLYDGSYPVSANGDILIATFVYQSAP